MEWSLHGMKETKQQEMENFTILVQYCLLTKKLLENLRISFTRMPQSISNVNMKFAIKNQNIDLLLLKSMAHALTVEVQI